MTMAAVSDEDAVLAGGGSDGADAPPRPKFKFLKKGEGTAKRVYASKFRKKQVLTESHSVKVELTGDVDCVAQESVAKQPSSTARAGRRWTQPLGRCSDAAEDDASDQLPPPRRWTLDDDVRSFCMQLSCRLAQPPVCGQFAWATSQWQ
jgi:hypothetical protein